MKVEIEISDELATRLSYSLSSDTYDKPENIVPRLERIIDQYDKGARFTEVSHENALAIFRHEAVKLATSCAAPGESAYTIEQRAEGLLRASLGGLK